MFWHQNLVFFHPTLEVMAQEVDFEKGKTQVKKEQMDYTT
jgi:hypothetical protein